MTVLMLQRRLAAYGYSPGPIDGLFGRLTRAALRRFQRDKDLVADGVAGPGTLEALIDDRSDVTIELAPPWLSAARALMGTREHRGKPNNPRILSWARRLGLNYEEDETPWCGLFVAHCLSLTLPDEALPVNPLGARNWSRFGQTAEPCEGALLIFWRGSPSGWRGHVGFCVGEDQTSFHVLGGNQSNSVTISRLSRARLLAARWPLTWPEWRVRRTATLPDQPLSNNEA